MKACLIINPNSGPKSLTEEFEKGIEILNQNGIEVEKHISKSAEYSGDVVKKAIAEKLDLIIAAGGDGTINGICNELAKSKTPLAIIPTGTANVLANELGIPTRIAFETGFIRKAFEVIVNGQVKNIDLGLVELNKLEKRYFAMWCGIGIDAKLTDVKNTPPDNTTGRVLNYLGWFKEVIRALIVFQGSSAEIKIDEKKIRTKLYQALISNGSLYGNYFKVSREAKLDDGKLDIFLFKDDKKRYKVFLFIKSLFTRQLESNMKLYQAKTVTIESKNPLPVHVDAETIGNTPVKIEVIPNSLRVFVPRG